ncbi:nucleotide exchange factor GrpE [Ureibacillus thermophilus]|uniref:Protein GrpE n=1 Tax=Ureibacillus thermophilus TaxID=367743 RepID=A0A4P6UW86_9BACL|nr:nucleotide exchange factor GrpE [Ureibacillus thermophilus]QBK26288.1 nucleotide exchange factor GrpE [Ureibacillus thermophilus]
MSETTENKNKQEETIEQDDTVKEEAAAQANGEVASSNEEASQNKEAGNEEDASSLVEGPLVEEYKAKIAELEAKLEEEENRYLRLRADFENMRRRSQLDLQAAEKYRAQSLLMDLLPVIDNFERALDVKVESEDAKNLYKGIEMVYNMLIEAAKKEGLEVIPAVDQPFDPNVHQAIMQESDPEKESGIVLKEFQKGYKLKDRVLRPSMVSVNE